MWKMSGLVETAHHSGKSDLLILLRIFDAGGRTRTDMSLRSLDFESCELHFRQFCSAISQ